MATTTTRRYRSHWKTTQGGIRPPRYATPPPLDRKQYVEPISPVAPDFQSDVQPTRNHGTWKDNNTITHDAHGLGLSFSYEHTTGHKKHYNNGYSAAVVDSSDLSPRTDSHLRNQQINLQEPHSPEQYPSTAKSRGKGHHRSGSNIDTLATIALATSPTFAHTTPIEQGPWSRTPTFNDSGNDEGAFERPAKRAKSEKLPSPLLNRKDLRPATSHVASYDSTMRNDAELLLNFARPATNNSHWTPFGRSSKSLGFTAGPTPEYVEPDQPPHSPLTPPPAPVLQRASPVKQASFSVEPPVADEKLDPFPEIDTELPALSNTAEMHVNTQLQQAQVSDIGANILSDQPIQVFSSSDKDQGPSTGANGVQQTDQLLLNDSLWLALDGANDRAFKEARSPKKKIVTESICAKCNNIPTSVVGSEQGAPEDWIECNACSKWYHYRCAGLKEEREAQAIDKYICAGCEPTHGSTTFVRKSSRPRTMIDYAGLNEGVIQTSSETNEHLYSRALRDGTLNYQADDFARIRPDMATIEQLENSGSGWNRPVVIPAKWNPRHARHARNLRLTESFDRENSPPLDVFDRQEIEDEDYMSDREYEEVIDIEQDALGMVIPYNLTVPAVSELIGPDEKVVDVIDVKTQMAGKKWSMRQWSEYYESKDPNKSIRNVISLEVSKTKLGRLIRRPQVVRDMDILDHVWPKELQSQPDFPAVQFYCLMSVADCYTDFHIDFGGSSVYYHIVKGKKTFFFIPPEEKNIKKYEDWCNSGQQHAIFLGDQCSECRRVDLSEGDTMLIPAGWIHAVWTPEDSLVIGGNFLTRTNYEMQFRIWQSEITIKIPQQFRYPNFQKVMWYSALAYLEEDPVPEKIIQAFQSDKSYLFSREKPVWHLLTEESTADRGSELYNTRHYTRKEIMGLPALRDYLYRTTLIASGHLVEGVTVKKREAVKKSMPKGYGDPNHLIRAFGIWVAWKTGNIVAPTWVSAAPQPIQATVAALVKRKKPEKPESPRLPPERQSTRVLELAQAQAEADAQAASLETTPTAADRKQPSSVVGIKEEPDLKKTQTTPKTSGLGPKRVACDACRKRRIKCRHKEETEVSGEGPSFNSSIEVAQSSIWSDSPGSPPITKVYSMTGGYGELTPLNSNTTQVAAPGNPFGSPPTVKKPGRTKACNDCRKSKRRCIHDEEGGIDPVKLQEPSKPRGSSSAKRPRTSDETPNKKAKHATTARETTPAESILVTQAQSALAPGEYPGASASADDLPLDPALREMEQTTTDQQAALGDYFPASSYEYSSTEYSTYPAASHQDLAAQVLEQVQAQEESQTISQAQTAADLNPLLDPRLFGSNTGETTVASRFDQEADSDQRAAEAHPEAEPVPLVSQANLLSNEQDEHDQGLTIDGAADVVQNSIEIGHEGLDGVPSHETLNTTSHQSSQEPRTATTTVIADVIVPDQLAPSIRRQSSDSNEGSKSDHTANSGSTNATNGMNHDNTSSHATSPMTLVDNGENVRGRSGSAKGFISSIGENEADEESMRLIREIQAQERGLRRRA